jgi:hypothetical protein
MVWFGPTASVFVDYVLAKEAEDVMVDFGGKGVPTRHHLLVWSKRVTDRLVDFRGRSSCQYSSSVRLYHGERLSTNKQIPNLGRKKYSFWKGGILSGDQKVKKFQRCRPSQSGHGHRRR